MTESEFSEFLEDISQCFLNKEFEPWKKRIIFPFSLITAVGPVVILNEDQLFENFQLYLRACEIMRLDEIVRRPISLENCDDGTWIGTYETNLLSHGSRATAPYTSSALMRNVGGSFKVTSILNARGHYAWTGEKNELQQVNHPDASSNDRCSELRKSRLTDTRLGTISGLIRS